MRGISDIEARIPELPLADLYALRERIDEAIGASSGSSMEISDEDEIQEMQQRLADFEQGKTSALPWEIVRERLRLQLR